jgi:hypothetical protein
MQDEDSWHNHQLDLTHVHALQVQLQEGAILVSLP